MIYEILGAIAAFYLICCVTFLILALRAPDALGDQPDRKRQGDGEIVDIANHPHAKRKFQDLLSPLSRANEDFGAISASNPFERPAAKSKAIEE